MAYGNYEASATSVMIPGLGMMVNDHPGLGNNVVQKGHSLVNRFWEDGTDSLGVESTIE